MQINVEKKATILTMAAPAGRCCPPPSRRATLSRAVWQIHDARSDESTDVSNDYEKEQPDELISKLESEFACTRR